MITVCCPPPCNSSTQHPSVKDILGELSCMAVVVVTSILVPHQNYSSLIFVWPKIVARALTTRNTGYQAFARVDTEGAGQRQYRVVHLLRGFALMSVSCCASVSMSCSGWCCTIFVCTGPFDIAEPSITRSTHRRDVGSTCCVVSGLWRGEFG